MISILIIVRIVLDLYKNTDITDTLFMKFGESRAILSKYFRKFYCFETP